MAKQAWDMAQNERVYQSLPLERQDDVKYQLDFSYIDLNGSYSNILHESMITPLQ